MPQLAVMGLRSEAGLPGHSACFVIVTLCSGDCPYYLTQLVVTFYLHINLSFHTVASWMPGVVSLSHFLPSYPRAPHRAETL